MTREELEALNKAQLVEKAVKLGIDTKYLNKGQIVDAILAKTEEPKQEGGAPEGGAPEGEGNPGQEGDGNPEGEGSGGESDPAPEDGATEQSKEASLMKSRMQLELARRQSRVSTGIAKPGNTTSALRAELAKRGAKFGVSAQPKDVSEALKQEIRNREIIAAK